VKHLGIFLYCPKSIIIVPHQAKTEAGFYMEVEPVEVAAIDNLEAVIEALERAWSRPTEVVPTPSPHGYSVRNVPSVKAAKAKSYTDFVRGALLWNINQLDDGSYQIERWVSPPRENSFVPGSESSLDFPAGTPRKRIFAQFVETARATMTSDC
jgi:hypothetical protein